MITPKEATSQNIIGVNGKPTVKLTEGGWEKAQATKVKDGDTVDVLRSDGSVVTCRIKNADAPETIKPWAPAQSYAEEASKTFESLLGDKNVDLRVDKEMDDYGRKLCLLAKDGKSINLEMVKLGAAWADHYKGGNPEFIAAEALAHAKKLGLHVDKDAALPWKHRKQYPSPKQ